MNKLIVCVCAAAAVSAANAVMEPATPESQGVSSAGILKWLDRCEKHFDGVNDGRLHGFVIVRHGKVVAEGSWKPFDTLNETHMLYSHSKSFTSTAVGFLVDEGKIDLDERLVDCFPEAAPKNPSENLKQLRVRDLLTMNVGKNDHQLKGGGDWVSEFMNMKFHTKPGTRFKYDSDATYMLAALVEKRVGKPMMDFLKERLFDKIGIEKAWTTYSPQHIPCGGWGMNMTTREIARFGQFCLQEGAWNGEQLISKDWMRLATTRQSWSGWWSVGPVKPGLGTDWEQGYGFQFWRCTHGAYRADGAGGQYTVIVPEKDLVVSLHAGVDGLMVELLFVWENLLPALSDGPLPEDPVNQAKLQKRLAALAIPPEAGTTASLDGVFGVEVPLQKKGHKIDSVWVDPTADGWTCTLVTPAGKQTVPVGCGAWKEGKIRLDAHDYEGLGDFIGEMKTMASGGVGKDGVYRQRIYLTGTTSGLQLEMRLQNGKPRVTGKFAYMGGGPVDSLVLPPAPSAPTPTGFAWRGFQLDEARHFFGKETVKDYLRKMAELKMNVFHWHLSDDQGWRVDVPGYPALVKYGAKRVSTPLPGELENTSDGKPYGPFYYTPDDISEIVAFAADLGITVVPEFDMPGHLRAFLAAFPEDSCAGRGKIKQEAWERWGICDDVLCVGNENAVRDCERVLDKLIPLFPGPYFHIGGDECPKTRWKTCPKCQKRMKDLNLKDEEALQGWFTTRLVRYVTSRGKRAIGWDEILKGGELPKETIIQCWRDAKYAAEAAQRGHDVIVSPTEYCYFTLAEGLPGDPYKYRAWTKGQLLPAEKMRAFDPLAGIEEKYKGKILGGECCLWSEYVHDRKELDYKVLHRLPSFAEALLKNRR